MRQPWNPGNGKVKLNRNYALDAQNRYDATVIDADDLSFTIIFVGDNKKHQDMVGVNVRHAAACCSMSRQYNLTAWPP